MANDSEDTPRGGKPTYAHTLSLRLSADDYRMLRRFVTKHEEVTNERLTHQSVIEAALMQYLANNKQG